MSDLPDGWAWNDAATVTEVQGGIQKQPKRHPVLNRYPFLRVANVMRGRLDLTDVHEIELFDGEIDRFRLNVGDLLVVEGNGSPDQIGRAALWNGDIQECVHQNHLIRVRPTPVVDSKYLAYYWNAPQTTRYLRSVASSTSGLYVLTTSKVRSVRIPLAPMAEQLRIVAGIEEQFSRIDSGHSAIHRATYNVGRLRTTLTMLADPTVLPQGWRRLLLSEVASVDSGPAFPSSMFKGAGEGVRLLRGENIEPGALRWVKTKTWPLDQLQPYKRLLVNEGDLILAMDRPMISSGLKLAQVKASDLPALLVQRVARIRPIVGIDQRFLHAALMSPRFPPHLLLSQTGTQLPHITLSGIRSYSLGVPPLKVQTRIAEEFSQIEGQIMEAQKAVSSAMRRINSLRSAILVAAFSGQLI